MADHIQYPGSIASFNGGLVDDLREPQSDRFALSKHFDIYSSPFKLTPYRDTTSESDATSAAHLAARNIQNFQLGKNGLMYALGNNGAGLAQVYQKTDPTTGNWGLATTAVGTGIVVYGSFKEWGTTPAFYMFTGTQAISKWQIGGTFTNSVLALGVAITSVAQSVVGADDNLYMFYNNRVVRVNNAGTATDNVLTNLPSNMRITSACVWGTFLAIGMAPGTAPTGASTGASKVFIWDMVTTTTVNDAVDWGEGTLRVLGNIEGRVVGVSDKYLTTPAGLTSLALNQGSMVVRMWAGATPQVMKEVVATQSVPADSGTYDTITTRFPRDVVVKDNKMYWVASVPLAPDSTSTESTYALGIWAFGRKNTAMPFALTLDYIEQAVDTSNFYINSFGNAGNYWFINHSAAFNITKTDSTANYTFTSIYESQIFNFIFGLRHRHINDSSAQKKLQSVTVEFDPLPSGAIVNLLYRRDQETAWTQIFTYTAPATNTVTADNISHSAINIENLTLGGDTITMTIASPAVVSLTAHKLVAGQIIQFTTTGALPTGVQAGLNYYVISTGLTANAFEFSATSGGAAINSTGSQSGVHTMNRTTNLPLYKEIQWRIESTGGAIITAMKWLFQQEGRDLFD
jgi:hypothetical protein